MNAANPQTIDPKKLYQGYDCVQCQQHHYEGEMLYEVYLYHQSKHGTRTITGAQVLRGLALLAQGRN